MAESVHRERLRVPTWWWLLAAGFVLSLWLALGPALGPAGSGVAALAVAVASAWALLSYGSVTVVVDGDGLNAGGAQLPLWAVGQVDALDGAAARAARGPEAGPSTHLLLRGYVDGVVRVAVADPDDATTSWVVSSRRPASLATALVRARDAGRA
jgi:Protein of unknown function (DUF3093)